MKIMSQMSMLFNLDKCLGCHTCTVACKNLWTNREGTEYMWWNNVETKPGIGYPREWENQQKYKGGFVLKNGKPQLQSGRRYWELLNIFYNPNMPQMPDYYGSHPYTFTYEDLHTDKLQKQQPIGRPKSLITGEEDIKITWASNWEDNAAGTYKTGQLDRNFASIPQAEKDALLTYDKVFYFYLPRICNHCLNPGCVAACPSGAAYKRQEDGIVLMDQERCRGWRFCVTSCPYKKPYYNWRTGKMEKCILCYPRVETGMPPACFHVCPGRIRYMGVLLYDLDRVIETVSVPDGDLVKAQRQLILDPFDPEVIKAAQASGIRKDWLDAAQRSPIYFMFKKWEIAMPLHPEFRTLPSHFYVPPESPMITLLDKMGLWESTGEWLPKMAEFRVPLKYLANLFAAGNEGEIKKALSRLLAMRQYKRSMEVDNVANTKVLDEVGLTEEDAKAMFRLLALAFYNERFVVPTSVNEKAEEPYIERGFAGFPPMKHRKVFHREPQRTYPY